MLGLADADRFARARIEVGAGDDPAAWTVGCDPLAAGVRDGVLGTIPASKLAGASKFTLRVVVEHEAGRSREARFALELE